MKDKGDDGRLVHERTEGIVEDDRPFLQRVCKIAGLLWRGFGAPLFCFVLFFVRGQTMLQDGKVDVEVDLHFLFLFLFWGKMEEEGSRTCVNGQTEIILEALGFREIKDVFQGVVKVLLDLEDGHLLCLLESFFVDEVLDKVHFCVCVLVVVGGEGVAFDKRQETFLSPKELSETENNSTTTKLRERAPEKKCC